MKILIVDDSAIMRRSLIQDLGDLDIEIVGEAADGNTAVKIFQEKSPDIVSLDITMPGMDGWECLEKILAIDPNAKVIMVSALADKALAIDAISKGAKAYLTKPVYKDTWQQTIQIMLDD